MVFNMIFHNKYFIISIIFVIFQQLLLGFSTWFIAKSGEFLAHGNFKQVKEYLILFFIFAILAYMMSAFVSVLTVKLKNHLWISYTEQTIRSISHNINLSSKENINKTIHWINNEASSTLSYASGFYIQSISTLINILFTFFVFYLTLGFMISNVLLIALITAFIFILYSKKKISISSNLLQEKNLNILTFNEFYLYNNYFGHNSMRKKSKLEFNKKMHLYFKECLKYIYIEQYTACIPIIIGVGFIIVYLMTAPNYVLYPILGTIVAVLPRTLQLFGNVHSLSISGTQVIMLKTKIHNLKNFIDHLKPYDFENKIETDLLHIFHNHQPIPTTTLINKIKLNSLPHGRYLIMGENGAGKSSLLKVIKKYQEDSILLSPDIYFEANPDALSTGLFQINQIKKIMQMDAKYLLLDEWDANLDQQHYQAINQLIEEKSTTCIIFEVRHKHLQQAAC